MSRVAVVGAGSWGTALAVHLGRCGHAVRLWVYEADLLAAMTARRVNHVFLPGIDLPPSVAPTGAFDVALDGAEFIVVAVPSHVLRGVVRAAAGCVPDRSIIVSATKGIEPDTLQRMSSVILDEIGPSGRVAALSGPSFAVEVARGLPTAVSVASADLATAERVQHEFRGPNFRLYATTDVVGVEVGAALKNVIAIAAGVVEGLELGHNAMAALVTRGLVEISRLACALGGHRETLAGLSGLGDLVLTCTGSLSRNRQVGIELGRGRPLGDILAGMQMVAEGVRTTGAAIALGQRTGVELPIAAQMGEVLAGNRSPREALEALMLRPQKIEVDSRP